MKSGKYISNPQTTASNPMQIPVICQAQLKHCYNSLLQKHTQKCQVPLEGRQRKQIFWNVLFHLVLYIRLWHLFLNCDILTNNDALCYPLVRRNVNRIVASNLKSSLGRKTAVYFSQISHLFGPYIWIRYLVLI